jgi:hypothetical protein
VQANLRNVHAAGPQRGNAILKKAGAAAPRIAHLATTAGEAGMFLASHTAPAVAPALATASIVVPPVGLLLQGAVTGIALRSAYKTHRHYKDLMKLWEDRMDYDDQCHPIRPNDKELCARHHQIVRDEVLQYVILKKMRKVERKLIMAAPIVSILGSVNTVVKNIHKRRMKTLGVARKKLGFWVAVHYLTCECQFTRSFIASLYSPAEVSSFDGLEYAPLWNLLMARMKSI